MAAGEETPAAHLPAPPSERRAWILACVVAGVGLVFLLLVLTGLVGARGSVAPPPVPLVASTPVPAAAVGPAVAAPAGALVARPSPAEQREQRRALLGATQTHISRRWMEGFYPIYATAQRTFGVDWLLIASIHRQESAFSTAPGIYGGLNFAHCCGGPMQFNVTNGTRRVPSTWALVSGSYLFGQRPASYDHATAGHPSIYDDFDSIMAAAHLLSADGAGYQLDASAWNAAYDYYGHDLTGVLYADEVLARAIGWSQHGFCINCGVSPRLIDAVEAAYGAPVRAALRAPRPPARSRGTERGPVRR
ncbi:MAG TPA: hypothetical protein VFW29_10125 [Solirubrobacteraceae bacterium]|nr:hypothetical protein [Solirubrobacteraceae bacterium]